MKTIIYSLKVTMVLMLIGFSSTQLNAQCAVIHNESNCMVNVDIEIWQFNGSCNVCSTIPGVNIKPGTGYPVFCTGCNPVCDILVIINTVGGLSTTPPLPSAGNQSNPSGTTFSSMSCNAFRIDWSLTGTDCKIQ